MWTVDQAKSIDMKDMKRMGFLCGYKGGNVQWTCRGEPTGNVDVCVYTLDDSNSHYLKLQYKVRRSNSGEEWRDIEYKVTMISTPCRFGGKRWWFFCPNTRCSRRVRILYSEGDYFVCRKCARLYYDSQKYTNFGCRIVRDIYAAEDLEIKMKRWYYAGKPTKNHRKYLRLTRGLTPEQQLNVIVQSLKGLY